MFASCNLISSAGLNSKGLPTPDASEQSAADADQILDHSTWDNLLKKHVRANGMVDYKGFKTDRAKLDEYLKMLSSQEPS